MQVFSGDVTKIEIPKRKYDFIFDRGCYHHLPKKEKPKFAKKISGSLKKRGKYFVARFSDKNPEWDKNVSREEIRGNFSPYFEIGRIRDYSAMEKNRAKTAFLPHSNDKNRLELPPDFFLSLERQ